MTVVDENVNEASRKKGSTYITSGMQLGLCVVRMCFLRQEDRETVAK